MKVHKKKVKFVKAYLICRIKRTNASLHKFKIFRSIWGSSVISRNLTLEYLQWILRVLWRQRYIPREITENQEDAKKEKEWQKTVQTEAK
jgi:hypothetical protein